jgi:hypothetical protein
MVILTTRIVEINKVGHFGPKQHYSYELTLLGICHLLNL